MAKKKRYLPKEVKTVEVYRKPTLQEAWDVVSDHLETLAKSGVNGVYVDYLGLHGEIGKPNLNTGGHDAKMIIESSRKWEKGW